MIMDIINEEKIKEVISNILLIESSKVKREDYNKVQYKLEELHNSLNETIKEFKKLESYIPLPLKTLTNGRLSGISTDLMDAEKLIIQLKKKIQEQKRNVFTKQSEDDKK